MTNPNGATEGSEILFSKVEVGDKTIYTNKVINSSTGQVLESSSSKSPSAALAVALEYKKKYPSAPFVDESGLTETSPSANYSSPALPPPTSLTGPEYKSQSSRDIRSYSSLQSERMDDPGAGSSGNFGSLPLFNTSRLVKKARDTSGMSEKRRKEYEELTEKQKAEKKISGVFGTKRAQAIVQREMTPSEVEVGRGIDNNAFIIIGNDRVSKPHTGYGGKGHTQCDAIDLVVGLGGFSPKEVEKVQAESGTTVESPIKTNPNFYLDSARIYISQKTDVDKNFGLCEFAKKQDGSSDNKDDDDIGKYGAKSAIALKADNVRLVAREAIRLVTGADKFNSQGGKSDSKTGIELVAMNKVSDLQPIVLGDNLAEGLTKMLERLEALENYINAYIKYQMKYNQAVANHTHHSPFFALNTLLSEATVSMNWTTDLSILTKTERSALTNSVNIQGIKATYLADSGTHYINSRLNKSN
jgi:hypothetical protein